MESSDTQSVEITSQQANAVLRPVVAPHTAAPAQQVAQPAVSADRDPVEVEVPVINMAPPQVAPTAPAPTAQPTQPAPVADADPYAQMAEQMLAPTAVPVVSDEIKAYFKSVYGQEDPIAYKADLDTRLEQIPLLQQQVEQLTPIKAALEGLNPTMAKVVELALAGKAKEAQDFIRSTPASALEGRAAAQLTQRERVDTEFPGKITAEQWKALEDPETDPDIKDALKTRIGLLDDTATDRIDGRLAKYADEQKAGQQARKEQYDNYQRGVAATLAAAKNSPLKAFVDPGVVEEVSSGRFLSRFVKEDGVTPQEGATTLLLKGLHFDNAVKAAEARGRKLGQQEQALQDTSRQPAAPSGGRSAGDPPTSQDMDQQVREVAFRHMTARR